ncbi:MAG: MMPL family transporter, partial [Thermotogota bacterium]
MMVIVGRFVQRFWKEIILVSILITAFFGYYASTISINTDLTTLLPKDDEYAQQYKELFSGDVIGDSVVIVFEYDGDRDTALQFVGQLKKRLEKKVDIVKFFQNIDSMAMMGTTGLFLSESNIFEQLTSTLNYAQFLVDNPAAIDFSIVRNAGESLKKIEDVFNKVLDIENPQNYVIFSPDNKIFLFNLILTKPALDLDFASRALNEIEADIRTLLSENEIHYQYGMTGSYQQALDTNAVISKDLSITTIITLTAISLLFFLVYGNVYTTLSIFISLIIGTLWSVGIFQFIFQSMDFMSSFVIALLLGLGIDFGIHLSHRVSEELSEDAYKFNNSEKKGKRELTKQAVISAVKHSGRNTLIGGLTTIAAFMSLIFVDSPALQRVSIMAGIGILTFLFVMIVILPSLLIYFYRYLNIKEKGKKETKSIFKKMVKGSRKNPKIIVITLL